MKQENISISLLPAKEQHLPVAYSQARAATPGQITEYLLRLLMVIAILLAVLATDTNRTKSTIRKMEDVVLSGEKHPSSPSIQWKNSPVKTLTKP